MNSRRKAPAKVQAEPNGQKGSTTDSLDALQRGGKTSTGICRDNSSKDSASLVSISQKRREALMAVGCTTKR